METSINLGGPIPLRFALLILGVIGVAFFSSAEASLLSINKFRLRHLASRGHKGAQAASRVLAKHEQFFAAILLTENALIILASSVGTTLAISYLGEQTATIFIATFVMTVFVVIFGEITPKTLAAQYADRWALLIARPIELVITAETLVLHVFTFLPRLISRVLGEQGLIRVPSITEGEIRMLVDIAEKEGTVHGKEADLVENVFRAGDKKARDVMTARTRAQWVHEGMGVREFLALYHRRPEGRFPVYKESVDNVVGVLATRDVLKAIATGELKGEAAVTSLALPPFFTPETKPLLELLDEMRASGAQMAIAVDEFGGVAGSVTLAQVLEPLLGPLTREALEGTQSFVSLSEDTVEVNGDLALEEANEQLGLGLPEGDYMTVAGMVLDHLGHIPTEGETFNVGSVAVRVARMQGRRIAKVRFRRLATTELEGIRTAENLAP